MKSLTNIILLAIALLAFTTNAKATNTTLFWKQQLNETEAMFQAFSGKSNSS